MYIERCFPIVPNAVEESEWFDLTDRFDKKESKEVVNTDINKAFDECLELFEEYPKNPKSKEQPKEAVKEGHKFKSKKKKNKNCSWLKLIPPDLV